MGSVQPEQILRELAELWTSLADQNQGDATAAGVLRACTMTLIVAAEDASDAETIGETVAQLMHEHPSRAIVLKPAPVGGELDAHVSAQCWMPFGSRQQICCEVIEIVTPEDKLDQVSRVLIGLMAPDLPAVLWARGPHWFDRPGFELLFPLMDKVVLDSTDFEDSTSELSIMRRLHGSPHPRLADLAWARLTIWRELIANTLPGDALARIGSITVRYFGDAPSTSCYYLAAWLANAIPDSGVQLEHAGGGAGRIAGVHLAGVEFALNFDRESGETVRVSGLRDKALVLPHASDYSAMREELAIEGADAIFDAVWHRAERMRANPEGSHAGRAD